MNKEEQAYKQLKKGIEVFVKQAIEKAPITRVDNAIIISNGTREGYKIKINFVEYDNIKVLNGVSLSANDIVKIIVPNGNMNNMFILGKIS